MSVRSTFSFFSLQFLILLYNFSSSLEAKEGEQNTQCSIGNFALPLSQQPGPLVSFGENIIERNQVQLFLLADDFAGKQKHFVDVVPSVIYGITDEFSVFFNIPIAASYKENKNHSFGLEDIFLQFEYAVYTRLSNCSSDQVTLVSTAFFPTGSSDKNPPTGFGSMSFFIGTTYNHTWVNWFCFTSYGALFPTEHHKTRFGNQYLYQVGFGRDFTNLQNWIVAWMIEVDGTFYDRNRIHGKTDPDSGGNVIYLTPSLWVSSKDWILQLGLGYAVQQHLFGNQARNTFLAVFDLGRTF